MANEGEQQGGAALDEAERIAAEAMESGEPPDNVTPITGGEGAQPDGDQTVPPGLEGDETHVGGADEVPSDGAEPRGDGEGAPPSDEAEQPSYLPPTVPEGFILAPGDSAFANATWLRAGPEITELIDEVLDLDHPDTDFRALAMMDWDVCWRRATSPTRNGEPVYASVWVPAPRVEWEVLKHGIEDFPRFSVDIHWEHFADLAKDDQPAAVHRDYVKRDIHYALAGLLVENDRIVNRPPVVLRPSNVREFGAHGDDVRMIKRAFDGWAELLDED